MSLRTEPLGRLTRWRLPATDPAIDALPEAERRQVGQLWLLRIDGESRAVDGFARLSAGLESVGADAQVVALARRAVDDERRHAELCRRVAGAYLGREVLLAPPSSIEPPAFPGAAERALPTLLCVSMCCMQETTSSTFIEACLSGTSALLARAVLRELLADEIDHARIGWAHLGSAALPLADREAVAPWLLAMARANYDFWYRRPAGTEPPTETSVTHGCGSRALAASAAIASTRSLIAPGLARCGFIVPALEAWVATLPPG